MKNKTRIAFISFRLESNFHAPSIGRSAFFPDNYHAGEAFERLFGAPVHRVSNEFIGFSETMDDLRPWERVPIVAAETRPAGCMSQAFYEELKEDIATRLKAAIPLDAVFFAEHGAATATEDPDPAGHYSSP